MNKWLYASNTLDTINDMPANVIGFVYLITHVDTGLKYIGKKSLYTTRNIPYGKKAYEQLKIARQELGMRGATPKKQKVIKESNWLNYYSSNDIIRNMVKEGKQCEFQREILQYAYDKKELTYLETKFQFLHNVLEDDNYLNSNILGKFYPNPKS